jgi:hypothetical protein
MRHNFASHRISILHDFIAENARQPRFARAKAADAVRGGGNALLAIFWPCFSGETAEAKHLLDEGASRGVRLFD